MRMAVIRFDSAIRSDTPIALIRLTASVKRVTTTGASPSKGSSSSRIEGDSAIARATAAIFFWPPDRCRPRRSMNALTSGNMPKMRSSTSALSRRPSLLPALQERSEEHTSELQSRGHLVCRLLLEKKKKTKKKKNKIKNKIIKIE